MNKRILIIILVAIELVAGLFILLSKDKKEDIPSESSISNNVDKMRKRLKKL